jgi:MFS family permease
VFNLVYSLSAVPAGIAADRFGKKKIILLGFLLFAALYYGFAVARTPTDIWFLFAFYGLFMGLTEGIQKAFLAAIIPPAFKATAFGVYATCTGLAMFPASLIGGWLWDAVSPAATFYFGAGTAVVSALLFVVLLLGLASPPPPAKPVEPLPQKKKIRRGKRGTIRRALVLQRTKSTEGPADKKDDAQRQKCYCWIASPVGGLRRYGARSRAGWVQYRPCRPIHISRNSGAVRFLKKGGYDMGKELNRAAVRVLVTAVMMMAVFSAAQRDCAAGWFSSDNQDGAGGECRCTVLPNAVTKVSDGVTEKGHLVGCQGKSYACLKFSGKYECRDTSGKAVIPFDFPMTDHFRFCGLLCTTPQCAGGEWKKR